MCSLQMPAKGMQGTARAAFIATLDCICQISVAQRQPLVFLVMSVNIKMHLVAPHALIVGPVSSEAAVTLLTLTFVCHVVQVCIPENKVLLPANCAMLVLWRVPTVAFWRDLLGLPFQGTLYLVLDER